MLFTTKISNYVNMDSQVKQKMMKQILLLMNMNICMTKRLIFSFEPAQEKKSFIMRLIS